MPAWQVVEDIEVQEMYVVNSSSRGRQYTVIMRFADPAGYPPEANLGYDEVRQPADAMTLV
jgi:hypothetical protein